jgi:hypothetical protein
MPLLQLLELKRLLEFSALSMNREMANGGMTSQGQRDCLSMNSSRSLFSRGESLSHVAITDVDGGYSLSGARSFLLV